MRPWRRPLCTRRPVASARAQALAHPFQPGATVFGLSAHRRVSPEWAAWANGVAVRELDFHDTFLAADYSHPGDNIPPILAVAQHCGLDGAALVRGIATGYEIQVDLVKGICLHEHKIDHIAHLGPSAAAGIGAALGLPTETVYQAVQQALHVTTTTRQSRKGEISSWKAYAPAFAGKMAVEAVDRVMRGEGAPLSLHGRERMASSLICSAAPKPNTCVPLPEKGEPKRAILDTYTKEHSAEYQSQALIDLARRMGPKIKQEAGDLSQGGPRIVIHTSHHTHYVIGTGAGDPAEDGSEGQPGNPRPFHHVHFRRGAGGRRLAPRAFLCAGTGFAPVHGGRSGTRSPPSEDPGVDAPLPQPRSEGEGLRRPRGGDAQADGRVIADELAIADAHPLGAHPFGRA